MARTFMEVARTTESGSTKPLRSSGRLEGRTGPVRALLLLGFCSLALAQTPPETDWRFAHPDADMKISLNLQAILNSPAVMKAIDQGKSQAKDNAAQIQLVLAMLKTVDRISVSGRQRGPSDMDVLAQVTGSFDPQLIAGFFPSTGKSKVKVVGPHTILIGEGDSFARASERMASGAPMPGDEMEKSDIWLTASSSFLAKQAASQAGNAAVQQTPPVFQSLHDVSLGLNLGEAPEINMLLTTTDAAAAGEMLKTFQDGIGQLAQATPMAGVAAKALSMKQDGSRVRLHFVVPPELLALGQQLAQQQAASGGLPAQLTPLLGMLGLGGPASAVTPPARAITPVPPPQNGGKIVIYGLDGGPKEIPAK